MNASIELSALTSRAACHDIAGMKQKLTAWLCLLLAAVLLLLALLTMLAMVQALLVTSTLAAVESAFGSFVLGMLLLLAAGRLYAGGRASLRKAENDS